MAGDVKSPQILLQLLCSKITGLKDDAVLPHYKMASTMLSSAVAMPTECDEFVIAEKIKKKLVRLKREKDAVVFSELHRKLQAKGEIFRERGSVLYLLLRLGDITQLTSTGAAHSSFFQRLPAHQGGGVTSTPHPHPGAGLSVLSGGTSGISSIQASVDSREPTPHSYMPTPYSAVDRGYSAPSTGQRLVNTLRSYQVESSQVKGSGAVVMRGNKSHRDNSNYEVPESVLVKELLYVVQGIDAKHISFSGAHDGYITGTQASISASKRQMVTKLSECGWLYKKIRKYIDARTNDRAFGLVGQGFCAALQQELTEYYRLLTVLQGQVEQEEDDGLYGGGGLSLSKLAVWMYEPKVKLKALAVLVDVCQGKKGGALASTIYSHMHHGDPYLRSIVSHCLSLVAQPVYSTIRQWMYEGELHDTYHEFFVASDPMIKEDRLWHEKYNMRRGMVPSFLTDDQASKILLSGKSINFLRQVCHDRTTVHTRDVVKNAHTHQVSSMFLQHNDGSFQRMIDTVYKETSQHLLHILHTKYKFMDHLKAMRRYLLLGQGDFIRHLMDLLEADLAKPATQLYLHNLSGTLETAVRSTNAQYEDPDILKRLDVRLLEVSPGDTGWDVFSLDYHVDGPIRTIFQPECIVIYLRVFNFLWRAKRMEYILAGVWKGQMSNARMLKLVPELQSLFHQCHVITCEMVHFVQQVQYYINFEVLECCWEELVERVRTAQDLDHIIAAHQVFLDSVVTRSLLDHSSTAILTQLRTIFDLIIKFQGIQDTMYKSASEEMVQRQLYEQRKTDKSHKGAWSVTEQEKEEEMRRRAQFEKTLVPVTGSQLRVLAEQYQRMVRQFLIMLVSHPDASLRFLSFRLDFNEHYRAKEPGLRTPGSHGRARRQRVSEQ